MTPSLQYFMVVAMTGSITKAAEQLYLSQQNLSNHIRKLEKDYGVLFDRNPHFKLTATGEALFDTLRNIKVLENGLDTKLTEIRKGNIGKLKIGLHAARARIYLPNILNDFWSRHPDVQIDFSYQNMIKNEKDILDGTLDMALGVDPHAYPEFDMIYLNDEYIYFVASKNTLDAAGISIRREAVTAEELTRFSFIQSPINSRFYEKIKHFCDSSEIKLLTSAFISDFDLQLILATQNKQACFTPDMALKTIYNMNYSLLPENKLYSFRIEGFNTTTKLRLILHKSKYRSIIISTMIDCFIKEFKK